MHQANALKKPVTQHRLQSAMVAGAGVPGPGSLPNLNPQRQWRFPSLRRGQEAAGEWRDGSSDHRIIACGMQCSWGCRPSSLLLPPEPAQRALVGSVGTPFALSHTCTVARQLGRSCNTSAAIAGTVFSFPDCSVSP